VLALALGRANPVEAAAASVSALLSSTATAETYWNLSVQDPTAWSQEVDLRPSVEEF
jgi:hypothetical protein